MSRVGITRDLPQILLIFWPRASAILPPCAQLLWYELYGMKGYRVKGALCAYLIRLRVSYNQNDETLSRNSLRYLSKASLPIAVH